MQSYFITDPDMLIASHTVSRTTKSPQKELEWRDDCNYNYITTNLDSAQSPSHRELLLDPL